MPSNDTTQYEETYLQGYFEFRLCPHNTRRRPAQQARSEQSQNLKETNTLNVKQENKINASIDLKHTNKQTLSCNFPFDGVTKEFLCNWASKALLNSLQQGCFDQHLLRREGGGVRFLPLPPEQVGSRSETCYQVWSWEVNDGYRSEGIGWDTDFPRGFPVLSAFCSGAIGPATRGAGW